MTAAAKRCNSAPIQGLRLIFVLRPPREELEGRASIQARHVLRRFHQLYRAEGDIRALRG
jgi:hypothetical protein